MIADVSILVYPRSCKEEPIVTNVSIADPGVKEERLSSLVLVAQQLNVSVWTVRRWVQLGRLASVKLGSRRLIADSEIQRAIKEGLR